MAETHRYLVPGISCEHCKHAIETHVAPLDGVQAVEVDVDNKAVVVTGGDGRAVTSAIERAGYQVA